jgi:MFS family permease
MPLAGGLSDRFGRLRLFAVSMLLFAAGSLVTATAGNLSQVVAGRLLQGAGGGALVPAVLALAADLYPAGNRSPVLGAISAIQEIGSVLGPLWGGLIAAAWGWRWIFWLNLPLAGLLLWALWPEIQSRSEVRTRVPLDWLGALLAGAGLVFITLALYASDPQTTPVGPGFWWQAPLAVLFIVLFVIRERRAERPLINVAYFRDSSFSGSAAVNAIAGAGLMVALVYVPVLAESPVVFSMNSRQAAFLLFRMMVGIPVGALLGGFLAHRLRSYRLVASLGLVLAAAGFFLLAGWDQTSLQRHVLGPLRVADLELFMTGLGLGLEIAPVSAAMMEVVGETQRGAAAALLVLMRLLGMLVGFSAVAGFGLYRFSQSTAHLLPPVPSLLPSFGLRYAEYILRLRQAILDQYHLVFITSAVLLLVGALIAAATLRPMVRRLTA